MQFESLSKSIDLGGQSFQWIKSVQSVWFSRITVKVDSNGIRTHIHFVRKQTLNHFVWVSVCLRTKWLWVRILLLSLKLQIWRLLRASSSLRFRQTIECRFTLKLVLDMITYSGKSRFITSLKLNKIVKKTRGLFLWGLVTSRWQMMILIG